MHNFRLVTTIRVRYAETDQMGVANNANYLTWFEVCRTELCRNCGMPPAVWEKEGFFLPVAECGCRYRHPAVYDDLVQLWCMPEKVLPCSVTFRYRAVRESDGCLLAEGWTKHAVTDAQGKLARKDNAFYRWMLDEEKKFQSKE